MFDSSRYADPWTLEGAPPLRIETPRLVLRCWDPADAPLFEPALASSVEHVGSWIPQAFDEPTDAHGIGLRLERFRAEFLAGVGFVYAILDPAESEVLGECGLMPRIGPRALEIGYWIRVDQVGRGLATEATHALTVAALALPEVDRIEIHCDPDNAPSAAVPRKLGYRLASPPRDEAATLGSHAPGPLVFEISVDEAGTDMA